MALPLYKHYGFVRGGEVLQAKMRLDPYWPDLLLSLWVCDSLERVGVIYQSWRLFTANPQGGQTIFYTSLPLLPSPGIKILATLVSPESPIKFRLAKEGQIGLTDVNKRKHRIHLQGCFI